MSPFPRAWHSLPVVQLRALLAPYATPYRHEMRRDELIRAIERVEEIERGRELRRQSTAQETA